MYCYSRNRESDFEYRVRKFAGLDTAEQMRFIRDDYFIAKLDDEKFNEKLRRKELEAKARRDQKYWDAVFEEERREGIARRKKENEEFAARQDREREVTNAMCNAAMKKHGHIHNWHVGGMSAYEMSYWECLERHIAGEWVLWM